jgi:hypothetical protein
MPEFVYTFSIEEEINRVYDSIISFYTARGYTKGPGQRPTTLTFRKGATPTMAKKLLRKSPTTDVNIALLPSGRSVNVTCTYLRPTIAGTTDKAESFFRDEVDKLTTNLIKTFSIPQLQLQLQPTAEPKEEEVQTCPKCQREVDIELEVCPHCGASLKDK